MKSGFGVILGVLGALLGNSVANNIIDFSDSNTIVFSNRFLSATVDVSGGAWISSLKGNFKGDFEYGNNLLTEGGIRLERENFDGSVSSAAGKGSPSKFTVDSNDENCGQITVHSLLDDISNPTVSEDWVLSMCSNDRSLKLTASGAVLEGAYGSKIRFVREAVYATPISTTGFYDNGVVQILGASLDTSHFASTDRLQRAFFLGSTGALDIVRPEATGGDNDLTVMLNADVSLVSTTTVPNFASGLYTVLVGKTTRKDLWVPGNNATDVTVLGAASWTKTMLLAPNDRNFPSSQLPSDANLVNFDNGDDLETFMTGIYANSVPCLCTYPNEVTPGFQVGQIATTLRHGNSRGYDGTYNYFDPDNFFSLSSMLYSGDPYLQEQVRLVIERTGAFIKQSNGQLPHHFNGIEPYYLALSGETQTGPNTFWTKTALRYAANSGNLTWLAQYLPTLRLSSSFVFDLITEGTDLVLAPGSLMIDVFIRNNYTADTNAMVVGFLRDFAEAEEAVGDATRAQQLRDTADRVAAAVNAKLWAGPEAGGDHYITQLNTDGTTRDFVDYDANLIAIANEVSDESRSRLIQARVDSGQCSAASGGGGQFVSEKYYGPDDTTNGNIGDSWCAMARISWFDARGRKRFGSAADLDYVNSRLIAPLQKDVITNTWMHERYGCDGLQQQNRTMYYFEYPAYASMLLREIRYGVDLGLTSVTVQPFGAPAAFEYRVGNVQVSYSADRVAISIPGSAVVTYSIYGLHPNTAYLVTQTTTGSAETVQSSGTGLLQFVGSRGHLVVATAVSGNAL